MKIKHANDIGECSQTKKSRRRGPRAYVLQPGLTRVSRGRQLIGSRAVPQFTVRRPYDCCYYDVRDERTNGGENIVYTAAVCWTNRTSSATGNIPGGGGEVQNYITKSVNINNKR